MKSYKKKIVAFVATGGWIGYAPIAPGTFGSIVALPLCWMIASLSTRIAIIVLLVLIAASTWVSHEAEKMAGQDDPSHVVVDEICGMAVALFGFSFAPPNIICGLAFFRLFDILKPFPIGWVDKKVSGGWGIMLDDLLAGMIANALLRFFLNPV
ncbi:MAG: hypothetical protein CSA23_03060 [Deltaproteobacteria bacterium]|nr:MAG: hypothetical protein CSA23_03060 [Deltaproteobacteria bacterium]